MFSYVAFHAIPVEKKRIIYGEYSKYFFKNFHDVVDMKLSLCYNST